MKSVQPTSAHIAFMNDLKATLVRHTDLDAMELLAVASQFVGNMIALQDQRRVTPAMAMELVANNIQIGNQAAVDNILNTKGSA